MTMGDSHRLTSALSNLQSNQKNYPRNNRGLGHKENTALFSVFFPV